MIPLNINIDDIKVIHYVDDKEKNGYIYLLIDTTSYRNDIIANVTYDDGNAYIEVKGCAMPAFGIFGEEYTPIQVDIYARNVEKIYLKDGNTTKLILNKGNE